MKFLGAEAELRAIGKPSGCIPVDGGRIDASQKLTGVDFFAGHNGIRMLRRIAVDMSYGFLDARNYMNSQAEAQILFVPILFSSSLHLRFGGEATGLFVTANFDAGLGQLLHYSRDVFCRDLFMHQELLCRVAN